MLNKDNRDLLNTRSNSLPLSHTRLINWSPNGYVKSCKVTRWLPNPALDMLSRLFGQDLKLMYSAGK